MPGSETETRLRLNYPEALPITAQREALLEVLRANQVVVVAGETGSGKSTQLPKLCLELGRGAERLIGHTQPRRLAARTVAARIAEELETELGDVVGYKVRFSDQVSGNTRVKLMTDGVLLAELRSDRELRRYDTLIIDEAHERSLNIDFLLGYLTNLLPRRPDLKLIVTSATIDTERFARHFDAPVVEVSGRTYPVEVRYREPESADQIEGIRSAVDELRREGPGDVLVFLSGQREIHDAARSLTERQMPDTEILPLYARLSAAEQQRAFRPHKGRRIVLATNVAETSITVPGVRYVVDTGTARISRYNRRTKLQRLPIEPVSQASANQRAGRCGRVAPGICIRLYAEDDYDARPEFTEPEILRTNLASVILQMADLGLGDVESFPFIDPPDGRAVADAVALLTELEALTPERPTLRLTPDGRRMARLPVDPRFGRMLLTAAANGCLREVTVIVAALSIQDPRERPTGEEQKAEELHARFAVPGSDFLAWLKLWEHLTIEQRARSGSAFRRMCRAEHLNFVRVREWQDLVRQLREATRDVGLRRNDHDRPAEPDAIHRSLLAGLLSHVGMWDRVTRDYRGARQARFTVASRSGLAKSSPAWIMAGELIETGRLWAGMVARIDPSWIEPLADHLVKRHHSEAHWSRRRGTAMTDEQVTLYGLPIVPGRPVPLERIDPVGARAMFVDHALIDGDWNDDGRYPFTEANRLLLDKARGLEARARRPDLVVDEQRLAEIYDDRLPDDVVSARHFQRWWKDAAKPVRAGLTFTLDELLGVDTAALDTEGFPLTWTPEAPAAVGGADLDDLALDLSYVFEPGADDDGVTAHVPLVQLPRVATAGVDWRWHVPGLRLELATALIRTLPKALRRELSPAQERARQALDGLGPRDGPLLDVLAQRLSGLAGVRVAPGDLDVDKLPRHLRLRFSVEDGDRVVASGRDLDALWAELARPARRAVVAALPNDLERSGLRTWPGGTLPRVVEAEVDGRRVRAYPTLVDGGETVAVRFVATPADQTHLMWAGTRRLLTLAVPEARTQAIRRLRHDRQPTAPASSAASPRTHRTRPASRKAPVLTDLSDLAKVDLTTVTPPDRATATDQAAARHDRAAQDEQTGAANRGDRDDEHRSTERPAYPGTSARSIPPPTTDRPRRRDRRAGVLTDLSELAKVDLRSPATPPGLAGGSGDPAETGGRDDRGVRGGHAGRTSGQAEMPEAGGRHDERPRDGRTSGRAATPETRGRDDRGLRGDHASRGEQGERAASGGRRSGTAGATERADGAARSKASGAPRSKGASGSGEGGSGAGLAEDCVTAAADRLLTSRGGPAWEEEGFRRLEEAARERLVPLAVAAAGHAGEIVAAASGLTERLDRLAKVAPALQPAVADMRGQLAGLIPPGFVTATGLARLPHLVRYVEAIRVRLDKLRERPDRDSELMARIHAVEAAYDELIKSLPPARRASPDVVEARWMLEELRVSLFAQTLGTAQPVSEQRLQRTLAALR